MPYFTISSGLRRFKRLRVNGPGAFVSGLLPRNLAR
jgi:hypothetical protein